MTSAKDLMHPATLCYEGDFDTQVKSILNYVRLTAQEVRNLRNLFTDLELALQDLAPGVQVHPFGSIVTGLGIRSSDVDCFISLPYEIKPSNYHIIRARNILKQHFRKFTSVFAITKAKVPIIKFLHIPTKVHCDINFSSPAGVHNSELICFLLKMDASDKILQLAVLIKYWSKVHNFTGTNLLASYALTMMVIFYLQLMSILPSISYLQRTVPQDSYLVNNWNTGFDRSVTINNENTESLYNLLGGFFKCYASMNFEANVISPHMGRLLSRRSFKNLNEVPDEFELYKHNLSKHLCPKPLNIDSAFCVQDPFEHDRNCAASVHPRLAAKICGHFKFAAKSFDELPPERFLEAIFTKDPTKGPPKVKHQPHQKHVFVNKVNKPKNIQPQIKRNVKKNNNLIARYEMIRNLSKK